MDNLSSVHNGRQRGVTLHTLWHRILLLGIVGFGAYVRFSHIPRSISGANTDDLINSFSGIRLYLLPWWNLSGWLRQNFFKSLLYTVHGLGDTLFYYPVVLLYSAFDIPLTEWNLFVPMAALSTLTLILAYCLAALLFDAWVGLLFTMFLVFSPTHVAFSTLGHQTTFVLFLQVSSVLAYLWYLRRGTRWFAFLAAVLLGIQAGSENFYYIAIFLGLHACHVYEERRSFKENIIAVRQNFLSRRNLLVWSPYAFMWVVNIYVYSRIGHQQDLTLLGHILIYTSTAPLGLSVGEFVTLVLARMENAYNMVNNAYPIYTTVYFAVVALNLKHGMRFTIRGLVWWWSVTLTALTLYSIKRQFPTNTAHLLVPSGLLIAITVSDGLKHLMRHFRQQGPFREAMAFGLVIIALVLALAPGALTAKLSPKWGARYASNVFRGMKAAGAVLRTLGNPKMNVFVLTTNGEVLTPLEYYVGLSVSNADYEPNQLFYHNPLYAPPGGGILGPETLIAAYGLKDFDFYVEFVREPSYLQKAAVLDRLKARGVRLVAAIYHGPEEKESEVRIYSSRAMPFRRYLAREQEELFDRRFANTENLFYNVNVSTAYYYGYHWYTEPGEINR